MAVKPKDGEMDPGLLHMLRCHFVLIGILMSHDVAGVLNTKMKSEQYQNSFRSYTSTVSCSLNRREVHFSAQEVHEGRHFSGAFSMLWLEKKHIAVRSELVDYKSALNEELHFLH